MFFFQISIILSIVQGVKKSDGIFFMLGVCLIGFVVIEVILVMYHCKIGRGERIKCRLLESSVAFSFA